jgi:hypothetical protein
VSDQKPQIQVHAMFRAVLVAAVVGFSWPYFFDVTIPGIPSRHAIPPLTEISLSTRSDSNGAIFARQVVNRSKKGDRLKIHRTKDARLGPAHKTGQPTPTPSAAGKSICEQAGQGTRVANDDVIDLDDFVTLARR